MTNDLMLRFAISLTNLNWLHGKCGIIVTPFKCTVTTNKRPQPILKWIIWTGSHV